METEIIFQIRSLELKQHRFAQQIFIEVERLLDNYDKRLISKDDIVKRLITFENYFSISKFVLETEK